MVQKRVKIIFKNIHQKKAKIGRLFLISDSDSEEQKLVICNRSGQLNNKRSR